MRTLPDIGDLLEPLERAISELLIPSLTEHNCSQVERDLVALPARMGGLGLTNPSEIAELEYSASIMVTRPLVDQIVAQSHQSPIQSVVRTLQQHAQKTRDDDLWERLTELQNSLPEKIQRALELANEKGASSWLTVIPVKDLDFTLNKREFRGAIRLRYDWSIPDRPSVCVCGASFSLDHAMVCKRGGFVIQRHNR